MQISKDKAVVIGACFGQIRQLFPTIAYVDALKLKPYKQRTRVREIAKVICLFFPHFAVIQIKHLRHITLIKMQDRLVPPHVETKVVTMAPRVEVVVDQGNTLGNAVGHIIDMRDRVQTPSVITRARETLQACALCRLIGSGLFHRERKTTQSVA